MQVPTIPRRQFRIGHPGVEVVSPEQDRQKQYEHQGKALAGGFEWPTEHQAPEPAGKILHHQQSQTTQAESQPENIGNQVAAQELVQRGHRANDAQDGAGNADHQPALLPLRGLCGNWVFGLSHPGNFLAHGFASPPLAGAGLGFGGVDAAVVVAWGS